MKYETISGAVSEQFKLTLDGRKLSFSYEGTGFRPRKNFPRKATFRLKTDPFRFKDEPEKFKKRTGNWHTVFPRIHRDIFDGCSRILGYGLSEERELEYRRPACFKAGNFKVKYDGEVRAFSVFHENMTTGMVGYVHWMKEDLVFIKDIHRKKDVCSGISGLVLWFCELYDTPWRKLDSCGMLERLEKFSEKVWDFDVRKVLLRSVEEENLEVGKWIDMISHEELSEIGHFLNRENKIQ